MKVTKGTIVRTIMLGLVLLNMILRKAGIDVIGFSESQVAGFVEMVIEVAVIITTFWKNNSFSPNAIKADKYLKELTED